MTEPPGLSERGARSTDGPTLSAATREVAADSSSRETRTGIKWAFIASSGLPVVLTVVWLIADIHILFGFVLAHNAFGSDGVLYSSAAREWLSGGDPWDISFRDVRLAAPPPSLLPFVLTAWLPEQAVKWLWVSIGFLAIGLTVVRLQLPIWCLLFPPAVYAALHGSIETVMVLFLVAGPRALAPVLKVYALIPLLVQGRGRDVFVAALIVVVTIPILPWQMFLSHAGEIGPRLMAQAEGGYSAYGAPVLFVMSALALLLIDTRTASFAIVPTLLPYAQQQYGAMLLPVIARLPIVAVLGILPAVRFAVPVSIVATAITQAVFRIPRYFRQRRAPD